MSEFSVYRMEKKIIDADGNERTLVSYDGSSWGMDTARAATRFKRATNLHKSIAKKAKHRIEAEGLSERDTPDPVLIPVWRDSPLLSRKKGKRKNRKNRKDGREVRIMKAVHSHRCHGKIFMCCCDTPWLKRKCGGDFCLYSMSPTQILKLMKGDK